MPKQTTRQLARAIDKLKDLQIQQQEIKKNFLGTTDIAKKEIFKKRLIDIHKKVQVAQKEFDLLLSNEPDPELEDDGLGEVKIAQNEQRLRQIIRKKIQEYSSGGDKMDRFDMLDHLLSELGEKETLNQITHAMSNDAFYDIYEYIARMNDLNMPNDEEINKDNTSPR
jgi:hypothetical protein